MDLGLKNKVALLTGSSSGLGFAAAHLLAREGAKVVINGRNIEKLNAAVAQIQQETGGEVYGVAADVTQREQAEMIVQETASHFGGLDILFANAGGPPSGPFESIDDETWEKAVRLSFLSVVKLVRASLPFLRKSNAASVLTVTSLSVKQPISNLILSNSIRLATIGLTKTLALELGNQGIRFNSILPAWTETDRVIELMGARAKTRGTTIEEEIEKQAGESVMGRMCTPEEFAYAAVFLMSPVASYISGTMLSVDGGMYKGIF